MVFMREKDLSPFKNMIVPLAQVCGWNDEHILKYLLTRCSLFHGIHLACLKFCSLILWSYLQDTPSELMEGIQKSSHGMVALCPFEVIVML